MDLIFEVQKMSRLEADQATAAERIFEKVFVGVGSVY